MYKIAFFLVIFFPFTLAGQQYLVESGFRNDSLDYEKQKGYFYRVRNNYFLSQKSSIGFTYAHSKDTEIKKYTWFLNLEDVSKKFSFLMGNFFINAGSGLLVSKPNVFDQNPFKSINTADLKNNFIPCKSGNPDFSFYGIVPSLRLDFLSFKGIFSLFGSKNKRFINSELYNNKTYKYSLNSLLTNSKKNSTDIEPVLVLDYGFIFSIRNYLLNIGFFSMATEIKTPSGDPVTWDETTEKDLSCKFLKNRSGAIFIKYKYNFISIFLEKAFSLTDKLVNNKKKTSIGKALQSGLKIKSYNYSIDFIFKNISNDFYSPYNNPYGYSNSDNGFYLKNNFSINKYFFTAINYSMESNNYKDERNIHEDYSIMFKSKKLESSIKYFRITKEYEEFIKQNLFIYKNNIIFNKYKNRIIIKEYKLAKLKSYLLSTTNSLHIFKNHKLDIFLSYIKAKKENPVYSKILYLPGSSSPNEIFKNKSKIFGIKYIYTKNKTKLYLKYYKVINNKNHSTFELLFKTFF